MSSFERFNVIEPPTSEEFEELIAKNFVKGLMHIIVLSEHQVPEPQPTPVAFSISLTRHSPLNQGGKTIIGDVLSAEEETGFDNELNHNLITIYTDDDGAQPAYGYRVVA